MNVMPIKGRVEDGGSGRRDVMGSQCVYKEWLDRVTIEISESSKLKRERNRDNHPLRK
jgi:hypothetical protein